MRLESTLGLQAYPSILRGVQRQVCLIQQNIDVGLYMAPKSEHRAILLLCVQLVNQAFDTGFHFVTNILLTT